MENKKMEKMKVEEFLEMKVKEFTEMFFDMTADDLLTRSCYPPGKRTQYYSKKLRELPRPPFASSTCDFAGLLISGHYRNWLCQLTDMIAEFYSTHYTITERLQLTVALCEIVLNRDLTDAEKERVNLATQIYALLTNQLSRHYNDSVNCVLHDLRLIFSMYTALDDDHLIENAKLALYLITDKAAITSLLQEISRFYEVLTDDENCTLNESKAFTKMIYLLQKHQ